MLEKVIVATPSVVYVAVRVSRESGIPNYIGGVWWREDYAKQWVTEWTVKNPRENWQVIEYPVLGDI